MRTPQTLKALLLSALVATAATLSTASATDVYFENDSGASGVVDVYVDGQLVFDDIFANSAMMFPRELAAGTHQIVITPNYLAPGQGDLLNTAVSLPDSGMYTLTLAESEDEFGVSTLGVGLSDGHAE